MLYLILEIGGYEQIRRLRPKYAAELEDGITVCLRQYAERSVFPDLHFLLFALDHRKNYRGALLQTLLALRAYLIEQGNKLHGFNLFVESFAENDPAANPEVVETRLYSLPDDNTLWFGSACYDDFTDFADTSAVAGVYRFEALKESNTLKQTSIRGFLELESRRNTAARVITQHIDNREPGRWLYVYGPEFNGQDILVDSVLQTKFGGKQQFPLLSISVQQRYWSPLHPFLVAFSNPLISMVESHLTETEKQLWRAKLNVLDFLCPDHVIDDVVMLFRLYLNAYIRYMKSRFLPAILLIYDLHQFSPEALEPLKALFQDYLGKTALFPIGIGTDGKPPCQLSGFSVVQVEVPVFSDETITNRVPELFPGAALSRRQIRQLRNLALPLYQALFAAQSGMIKSAARSGTFGLTRNIVEEFDQESQICLCVYLETLGFVSEEQFREFLLTLGLQPISIRMCMDQLHESGLLWTDKPLLPVPEFRDYLIDALKETAVWLIERLKLFLVDQWRGNRIKNHFFLFLFFRRHNDSETARSVLQKFLEIRLDSGMCEVAFIDTLLHEYADVLGKDLALIYELRFALIKSDHDERNRRYRNTLKSITETPEGASAGMLELAKGVYNLVNRESRNALACAKTALHTFQQYGEANFENSAQILIGQVMLYESRFEEALDYFSIALESAESGQDYFRLIQAGDFAAVTLFLIGNYSAALRYLTKNRAVSLKAGRRNWYQFELFLQGRCYFDLGLYDKALELFQMGLNEGRKYQQVDRDRLFYSWIGRTKIYNGEPDALPLIESLADTPEILFFRAEAWYRQNNYRQAIACLDRALEMNTELPHFLPGEMIHWDNGFASIEDRVAFTRSDGNILSRLIRSFRAFLIGLETHSQDGMFELMRMTREEKQSEKDPYNRLYYLFHALLLPHSDAEDIPDYLTTLSRSLKYVQERASRIDEVEMKQAYLNRNYWNALLLHEARRHKLM